MNRYRPRFGTSPGRGRMSVTHVGELDTASQFASTFWNQCDNDARRETYISSAVGRSVSHAHTDHVRRCDIGWPSGIHRPADQPSEPVCTVG